MDLIQVLDRMKQFLGGKSVQMRNQLKYFPSSYPCLTTHIFTLEVFADATLVFPLLVAATFAQSHSPEEGTE